MSLGLEYIDTVFVTIKSSDFAEYSLNGIKVLGVLLFLVNIIKKYLESSTTDSEYSWGLRPDELIKNLVIVLLVIYSTEILGYLDQILVAIEGDYRATAPDLLPLQLQEFEIEEEVGLIEAGTKALSLLYEYLITPLYPMKVIAFVLGLLLWLLDLFIYPLFLAERFFILGIMQAFFPLIISLSVFEKFREMGIRFFRFYIAVYMMVPAFFLVNVFVNNLYREITENFWPELTGDDSGFFAPLIELGAIAFIVFLKFKLYRQSITFTLRLFT